MSAFKGNVRVYMRVSTQQQTLDRQTSIIQEAKSKGYYIAGVYSEKASGAIENRPALQKLINDLQDGDLVVAEKLDRISRLPLENAEKLIAQIKDKGAKLLIPDIIDFSDIISEASDTISKIVLESMQQLLLKLALQAARDDYESRRKRQREGIEIAKTKGKYKGRIANLDLHRKIVNCHILQNPPLSIAQTAKLLNTSASMVIRACKQYRENLKGNK